MSKELIALEKNQTLEFVQEKKKNYWMNADDETLERFRACLVAKGYAQTEGKTYKEIFNHIMKWTPSKLGLP